MSHSTIKMIMAQPYMMVTTTTIIIITTSTTNIYLYIVIVQKITNFRLTISNLYQNIYELPSLPTKTTAEYQNLFKNLNAL